MKTHHAIAVTCLITSVSGVAPAQVPEVAMDGISTNASAGASGPSSGMASPDIKACQLTPMIYNDDALKSATPEMPACVEAGGSLVEGSTMSYSLDSRSDDSLLNASLSALRSNAGSTTCSPGTENAGCGPSQAVAAERYAALVLLQDGSAFVGAWLGSAPGPNEGRVTVDMLGDGLITVQVSQAVFDAFAIGQTTEGVVILPARSADALLDTVVNSDGVVRADTLVQRDDSIFLIGAPVVSTGSGGAIDGSGSTSDSGTGAGGTSDPNASTGGSVTPPSSGEGSGDGSAPSEGTPPATTTPPVVSEPTRPGVRGGNRPVWVIVGPQPNGNNGNGNGAGGPPFGTPPFGNGLGTPPGNVGAWIPLPPSPQGWGRGGNNGAPGGSPNANGGGPATPPANVPVGNGNSTPPGVGVFGPPANGANAGGNGVGAGGNGVGANGNGGGAGANGNSSGRVGALPINVPGANGNAFGPGNGNVGGNGNGNAGGNGNGNAGNANANGGSGRPITPPANVPVGNGNGTPPMVNQVGTPPNGNSSGR